MNISLSTDSKYDYRETITPMESIVFIEETIKHIGENKVSSLMPELTQIAKQWDLPLNMNDNLAIATRILSNSIKNN